MIDEAVDVRDRVRRRLLRPGRRRAVASPTSATTCEFVADQRLATLGLPKRYGSKNPFAFMELQDVQELANFFERRVSAYQVGVEGDVSFDEDF